MTEDIFIPKSAPQDALVQQLIDNIPRLDLHAGTSRLIFGIERLGKELYQFGCRPDLQSFARVLIDEIVVLVRGNYLQTNS